LNNGVGGSNTSQHLYGEAMDIVAKAPYTNADVYRYIRDNLDYDQLIWEFGNSNNPSWVHVSFKSSNLRKQQLQAIGTISNARYLSYNSSNLLKNLS
jgi:hypothetical protein